MIRLAVLLLSVCASGFGDNLHLRVVVDASSPAEYNRWVWQHRAECSGLRPVYITYDSSHHRDVFEWPAISFWSDSGPLLTHRILPDSQPVGPQAGAMCDISRNFDQLTVRSGISGFAMSDRFGRRLFTDPHRPEGITSGRWARFARYPPVMVLLDDSGNVLSAIPSPGPARILHTGDSVFALHAESSVVLLDRDGRVLWRSRKLKSPFAAAIGPNGYSVAAATDDSLVICSPSRARTIVLPHDREWGRFGWPTMAWSADGERLAVYQGSKAAWDSGRVFVMNTEGRLVRPTRNMRFYNVRSLVWMGDTLVFAALNVDVSQRDPRFSYGISADSCVISFLPPRGKMSRGPIHGKFRLYGTWTVSGRHLAYLLPPRQFMVAELAR